MATRAVMNSTANRNTRSMPTSTTNCWTLLLSASVAKMPRIATVKVSTMTVPKRAVAWVAVSARNILLRMMSRTKSR